MSPFTLTTFLITLFLGIQDSQFPPTRTNSFSSETCQVVSTTIKQESTAQNNSWLRTIELPASGRFVEESHYVTSQDKFIRQQWPSTKHKRIKTHLKRSLKAYIKHEPTMTMEKLYPQPWQKEWTPEEGGHFGQGSVGEVQRSELSAEMEMWFMTMMWAKGERPPRGTKFLLTANGKNVIVIAGYETGPSGEQYLGGVTTEVHQWLGTTAKDTIKVQLLKNQAQAPGPVLCP